LYRGDSNEKDYGREALDTLIAEMENHRDDFVVIMAGYTDDMDMLMKGNAGLVGRMPYVIEFPNFTREQLYGIFVSMLEECQYSEDLLLAAKAYFDGMADEVINSKEFSNARFVRNLYERTWAKALRRCQLEKAQEIVLCAQDFEQASSEKGFKSMMEKKAPSRLGFYE
jgi:stage V sporulation protein K